MEAQKAAGRAAWKGSGQAALAASWLAFRNDGLRSLFTGYQETTGSTQVAALISDDEPTTQLTTGQTGSLVTQSTPMYAESGGQVGDTGTVGWDGGEAIIIDTIKPVDGLIAHHIQVTKGTLKIGSPIELSVDIPRRDRIRLNTQQPIYSMPHCDKYLENM